MATKISDDVKSYTLDELMSDATPCSIWTRERCSAMMGDRETVTAVDVLTCADLSDFEAIYQAARMMSPNQKSIAARALSDEAQASAAVADAAACAAAASGDANAASDAAFSAAAAANADAANAANAADAAAAYAIGYDAYAAADAASARSMRASREIFLAVCAEVTT